MIAEGLRRGPPGYHRRRRGHDRLRPRRSRGLAPAARRHHTAPDLVLTGSWPAKTESGGIAGSANIVTTLTMSCRPAPACRPSRPRQPRRGRGPQEVKARIPMWDAAGLAPTDQLMASAGPAMEAVGQYAQVLNHLGDPVDPTHYLVVARRAVEEAAAIVIDHLPLETFDVRTRFALSWARLYRRSVAPKSEARWQALAADLSSDELKGVLQRRTRASGSDMPRTGRALRPRLQPLSMSPWRWRRLGRTALTRSRRSW